MWAAIPRNSDTSFGFGLGSRPAETSTSCPPHWFQALSSSCDLLLLNDISDCSGAFLGSGRPWGPGVFGGGAGAGGGAGCSGKKLPGMGTAGLEGRSAGAGGEISPLCDAGLL